MPFAISLYGSLLVWSLAITLPARGQSAEPASATWVVTLQIGAPISGPSSTIRTFMNNNALGGSTSYSGTVYPNTKILPSMGLHVEYFRPHSSLGINFSSARSMVEGTRDAVIRWDVVSFAPLYSYYSRQRTTRISAGPSLQWLQTEAGTDGGLFGAPARLIKTTGVVPGLVFEGALRFPAQSSVFMELGIRYEAAFGQLNNELHLPSFGMERVIPFSLRFNRLMFSIGIGFRLYGLNRSQVINPTN